jgi:hypothetical protein
MNTSKAQTFIKAIQDAPSSSEVIRLWTEAARGSGLSIQEIVQIHKACGNILVEAVHSGEAKEIQGEKEKAN